MTLLQLEQFIKDNIQQPIKAAIIIDAVRKYSSTSNGAKPIVSGALPLTDAEKLAVAWKALEWVGFKKGEEFENEDVLKMLSGNDR